MTTHEPLLVKTAIDAEAQALLYGIFFGLFILMPGIFSCIGCAEDGLNPNGAFTNIVTGFNILSLIVNRIFWVIFGWVIGSRLLILEKHAE